MSPAEERGTTAKLQEDHIGALFIPRIGEVLETLELLDSHELEVNCSWSPSTLQTFASYMGQMRNIYKCLLTILVFENISLQHNEEIMVIIIFQS